MYQTEKPEEKGSLGGKDLYFRLLSYVKPYRKSFALAIIFMIIYAGSQASIPILMQPLLDGAFVDKKDDYMFWAPIGIVLLSATRGISAFASQIAFNWVSTKVVLDLRQQIFNKYLNLPCQHYDHQTTGNLISKVTYDANQVTNTATDVLITIVRDSVVASVLVGYIIYLNWQLSLALLLLLPVTYILVSYLAKRLRSINKEIQYRYGLLTQILEESIKGQKEIKIYGSQAYEYDRFTDTANWVRRLMMKAKVSSSVSVPIIEIIGSLIIAYIVYTSASSENGGLTVGEFVSYLTSFILMLPPIKNLTKINGPLQRGLAAAESIFNIIDNKPEIDTGTKTLINPNGKVSFNNVSFTYPGADAPTLSNLDFTIPPGSTLAIVGPSGSGKSTIANLIPRFYDLSTGSIYIDEYNINDLSLKSLRKHLSYVSQDVVLFNDTISNNITYGHPDSADLQAILNSAKSAHALEFIEKLPDGIDTLIGENGIRLSGGQRQRIAIARAFLKNSPILLLDEATSALDTASERKVQAALESIKKDRTTLIIAHRLSTIEKADQILFIKDGSIIEKGNHTSLLSLNGEYASYYKKQLSEKLKDEI